MLNVFIDTNIFLDFYSLSEKDIEELHKLIKLINDEEIQLILSQNVLDEFYKNRIKKIYATTSNLEKSNQIPLPTLLKQYKTECEEFRNAQSELKKRYTILKNKLVEDVKLEQLSADRIIKEIFKISKVVPVDWKISRIAQQRFLRRLPPRKNDNNDSMGDAINWETLKCSINENEDLHIISGDGDFWDSIEGQNDIAKYFLAKEWKDEKNGTLYIYAGIKDFFDKKFASYNFIVDNEKTQYIEYLIKSGSFERTHGAISLLSKYNPLDFTLHEVSLILKAYRDNDQISWICQDGDVKDFFFMITAPKKELLDTALYLEVLKEVDPEKYKEEIPF
ncbi:MAG: DUF4935 domain-containing protein [Alphaproteobacteria bacterium]|nr:DUF4935 domain-containing protein [Alphaproteobacteria bacterium]